MKRIRLSPEARTEQLLEAAKDLILREGLQQFSLKKLAVEASVSEPLLFHYFSSRTDLLQQLLERDYLQVVESLNTALEGASSLQEILCIYACSNYDLLAEESLIDILLTDPDVASVIDDQLRRDKKREEKFLVDTISRELGIRRKHAAMVALMGSAASIAGARFAHRVGIDRKDALKIVSGFVAAAMDSQMADKKKV